MSAIVIFLAFICDWIFGDPQKWPHPVRLIGRLISFSEKKIRVWADSALLRPENLRLLGVFLTLFVLITTMGAAALILFLASWLGAIFWFITALYLVYSALCLKDLYYQTWQVEKALKDGFLTEARLRLAQVVGRDTADLDETAIRRALIETLAENFSDGLVAPMFYLAIGGPILAWGYKAINTLDSMIGYRNERYLNLGRFAAKLDDAANFVPARLAALLLILTACLKGFDWQRAWKMWRSDGHLHDSPNS
ncbi:MAG: adenosylcobinamide-phosphate synthase CbiB, partial [Candidatus Adiutrix sp.]